MPLDYGNGVALNKAVAGELRLESNDSIFENRSSSHPTTQLLRVFGSIISM